jgi:hypothetical protein
LAVVSGSPKSAFDPGAPCAHFHSSRSRLSRELSFMVSVDPALSSGRRQPVTGPLAQLGGSGGLTMIRIVPCAD